jgi:hypothetical protein
MFKTDFFGITACEQKRQINAFSCPHVKMDSHIFDISTFIHFYSHQYNRYQREIQEKPAKKNFFFFPLKVKNKKKGKHASEI